MLFQSKLKEKTRDYEPKTFEALIRETSVYNYFVELKEDALTERGFFDLVKVPDLFVTGVGQFLRDLRLKNELRLKDIAKIVGATAAQVSCWEKNRYRISLASLVKITETLGVSRKTIYELFNQGELSLKTGLPIKFEKVKDIIRHLCPHKLNGTWQIRLAKCSDIKLKRIKSTLNVKFFYCSKGNDNNQALMHSKELYNVLTTFFNYRRCPKIHPPLTDEVKHWYDQGIDLKRAIIIPCLQSDGCIFKGNSEHVLRFYGKSNNLHNCFVDAIYFEYNELPTSYFCSDGYATSYRQKEALDIINELIKLSGNLKTSPAKGQTVDQYLMESQPHLDYLITASESAQKIALRIWASTEGCIKIKRERKFVYPGLDIACAHPVLVTQLQKIAKNCSLHFSLHKSKRNWSGFEGLSGGYVINTINFLKLGGFIKGVKISSNSKYHEGIDKDVLLLGILELKKRELENRHFKKLSIQQIHHKVNKIIENNEYKSGDYYIDYFSKDNPMQ